MRRIMVFNPKGGCGKTTIATNLASYYAQQSQPVILADFDPQGSSCSWLKQRPKSARKITNIKAPMGKDLLLPHGKGTVIIDAPASVYGKEMKAEIKLAHTLLIPVLPSPIDIRASSKFIEKLLLVGRVSRQRTRIALIANRVKEHTIIYQKLNAFLKALDIPLLTHLRDSQNYIKAADQGLGIFELPGFMVSHDLEQWQPIIKWLNSQRSLPVMPS